MRYTTNVWELNTKSPMRVRLTVEGDGTLHWVKLYQGALLIGCGPSTMCLPHSLREACESRLASPPKTAPLLWDQGLPRRTQGSQQ